MSIHAVCMPSHVQLFVTPWTAVHQAPLTVGFSRQEYGSGLQLPSPGDLPDPEMKLDSLIAPALASGFFTTSTTWEALSVTGSYKLFNLVPCAMQ